MSLPMTPFNVEITTIQRKALTELAQARGISRGAMLRQLVICAHAHTFEDQPLCANGNPCYVPQMHQMARRPIAPLAPAPGDPPLAPEAALNPAHPGHEHEPEH